MKFLPVLLLFSSSLSAQITLLEFPQNLQLYPRNLQTNQAEVRVKGVRLPGSTDSLILRLEPSNGPVSRWAFALPDFPADTFLIPIPIQAALVEYRFELSEKSTAGTILLATANQVVAGDVIAVQGQSNAQAVAYNGNANGWQSPFVRCFGNSDPNNYTDNQWYIAEGNGYFTPGSIGQWALRMAYQLQADLQIPVAVVNGADPGKPIEFFQRNDALTTDPATNYGRFLQRLKNGGLDAHIRAMIYYQGESDGDRALIHKTLFEALHEDWRADFSSIEAFYVVQVREGCGSPSLPLRQYQKDFAQYLPKTHSITANGIAGHDGCHYAVNGYEKLGEKLFKHLAKDLYQIPAQQQWNIQALSARYTNDTNTQIEISTDAIWVLAEPGSNADFILSNGSSSVIGISTENNKILLELDQPVYDPTAGISYAGHAGDSGGWILNSDGFGMFSFYNLPIENHTQLPNFDIPGIMSGPGNCVQLDGQNDCIFLGPVLSSSYTKEAWVQWSGGGIGNNILSGASGTAFWAPNYGVGNQLSAGHNNGWSQVVDPTPLKPFEWMHVAVSYDVSTAQLKLYKNGFLVAESQDIPPHADPNLYIGAFSGAYTFHGKIDEVRVWDYARSLEEIRDHLCKKLKGNEVGLSAYFRLDQQDGLVTQSASGNIMGQVLGAPANPWKRSSIPLGTHSTYTYEDKNRLSLAFDTGDSLVWKVPSVPTFAHVYLTNEIPNVLEPADGHVLVDNSRYFGVYFPNNEIDSFHLTYHYKGNPFTLVDEPRLNLLQRKDNAQPFWLAVDPVLFDFTQNTAVYTGKQPQEMILAIAENTVGIQPLQEKKDLLYPNPTRDWLFVRIPDIVRFRLLDNYGQTCIDQKGQVWVVSLQELPAGIYHAEAELQGGGIYRQKIMVE